MADALTGRRLRLRRPPAPAGPAWREVQPDLRQALAPVAWAVWRRGAARTAALTLAAAGAWSVAVLAVSRLLPLPDTLRTVAAGMGACLAAALLLLLRRPRPWAVALAGDRAGLKQRLLTALELRGEGALLARAQRADAIRLLDAGAWRPYLRVHWPQRPLYAALLLAAVAAALLFLPDRGAELRRRQAIIQAETARQADALEKAVAAVAPPGAAAVDRTRELAAQALRKLQEQLKQTSGGQEAMIDLTEATRALEQLVDAPRVRQGRALLELSSSLASTERGRQAAEALSRRDWAGGQRGLENVANALDQQAREAEQNASAAQGQSGQQMSRAEQQALARALAEASRTAGADTSLGQALQRAARELMAGNNRAAAEALRELARQLAEAGRNLDSQAAVAMALQQLDAARNALQNAESGQPGQQGQGGQEGQEGQGGQQGQEGQGFAALALLGLLQGQGQGSGNGPGPGDDPIDNFDGNGELGDGRGSGPGANPDDRITMGGIAPGPQQSRTGDPPPTAYRQFEQIYAPTRLGGSNTPEYLSGALGEGSGQAVETDSAPVGAPPLRPYSEVYTQYQEQAREGMERAELPAGLEEMVKRYFSNLAPRDETGR